MSCVIISNKGQVVIPAELRRQMGMLPGSLVEVSAANGKIEIELKHPAGSSSHDAGFGMLKYSGPPRRLSEFDVSELMAREREEGGS
ncbi:MAG: AbrB/MazE/SpoVT family DNA-binding domain-containing protein [Rhodocyclaceae bacterium]|nr:AbrB/MazE/SpoVT family DNA-binding domain-containing protein [Rhodocyclaceae bacterium]